MNEPPLPIGLYSVVSVIDLKIKRDKHWRTVRAMAWKPEELAEFLRKIVKPEDVRRARKVYGRRGDCLR